MTLVDKAICFAVEKHSGQRRKGQSKPYILHPLEAVTIVGTMTDDPETLAAAALHDTVEDAGVTFGEIKEQFGRRVALLVMTETEDKREELPHEQTWQIRKEETLVMLENTKDLSVKMMWLGDKLSNMRDFYRMYRKKGDALWQEFNQKDPARQAWYYRTILHCLHDLKEYDAYQEFAWLVGEVFQNIAAGEIGLPNQSNGGTEL